MKTIALYGGAFDPPHIGHISLIKSLKALNFITEVWLLPCGRRTDKDLLYQMDKRFNFLRKIFSNDGNIKVADDEIRISEELGKMINTYDLMRVLHQNYVDCEFHFVIGADNIKSLRTWPNGLNLVQENRFIIFPRKGYQIDKNLLPLQCQLIQKQLEEISSAHLKQIIRDKTLEKEEKISKLKGWIDEAIINDLF